MTAGYPLPPHPRPARPGVRVPRVASSGSWKTGSSSGTGTWTRRALASAVARSPHPGCRRLAPAPPARSPGRCGTVCWSSTYSSETSCAAGVDHRRAAGSPGAPTELERRAPAFRLASAAWTAFLAAATARGLGRGFLRTPMSGPASAGHAGGPQGRVHPPVVEEAAVRRHVLHDEIADTAGAQLPDDVDRDSLGGVRLLVV